MKKLWSIILILALVIAPCVVVHASYGTSSQAFAAMSAMPSANDSHDKAGTLQATYEISAVAHDHDEERDHDCQTNCGSWLNASASSIHQRMALLAGDNSAPLIFTAYSAHDYQISLVPENTYRRQVPADIVPPAQSVLERTARLRI